MQSPNLDFARRLSVLALACTVPLAARAQPAAAPGFNSSSQVYRCASGVKLPVMYLNIVGGDSFATLYVNGTLALLRSGPTGSGANYLPVDDKAAYRWHVKGDLGNLWFRTAQPGAAETMLLQNCKAQAQS
jgi:membrane-bound inhibitor of C-type lysozyme